MVTVFGRMGNPKVAMKVLEYLSTQNSLKTAHEISVAIAEDVKDIEHSISQIVEKYDWLTVEDTKSGLSAVRNGTREIDIKRYLDSGGFIRENQEIEAADIENRKEKERQKRVDETTIAVNEETLKYSRLTRIISVISLMISLIALLLQVING